MSGVGSSVESGQTTAIPAEGVATVGAVASSIAATTAVPAAGSSSVEATTPTTGGGIDGQKKKIRKRVNELNKKILEAEALEEAQEITQTAVTKAKSAPKSADQGFDEDEEEALMLLL